jgi:hypothetical protein
MKRIRGVNQNFVVTSIMLVISLVGFGLELGAETRYNFSYTFRGEMELDKAPLMSFWFFLEASASADFTMTPHPDGGQEFTLDAVNGTGYIARTRGLFKKSLKMFTAQNDRKKSRRFVRRKWDEFRRNEEFSSRVKKYREFPFLLPDDYDGAMRFRRDNSGYYRDFENRLKLTYVDYEKDSYPYNNVYAIMFEILEMYPPLPEGISMEGKVGYGKTESIISKVNRWHSPPMYIDTYFNNITGMCSRSAGRNINFTQEDGFRMTSQVTLSSGNILQITSYTHPEIKIYKKMYIREFKRVVFIHRASGTMLEDRLMVRIENKKGKGLTLEANLVLINGE